MMEFARYPLLLLFPLVVGVACSNGDEGDADDETNATGGAGGATSGSSVEQPEAGKSICDDALPPTVVEDLSGKWAYVEVQTQVVNAPGFAAPFRNLVITSQLWELTQDGTAVTGHVDVCDRYVRGGIVDTTLSAAFIDSIEDFDITASYDAEGNFAVDRFYLLLGATLEDPSDKESLPTDADDERVFDQDGDGNPASTVRIQGLGLDGRIYNVQWSTMAPTGATVSETRIEGLLHFDATENVLGSDPPVIASLSPESNPHPNDCWSTFQMARLDEEATCDTVVESFLELFPDLESTDP
jgi:hypothetical protein